MSEIVFGFGTSHGPLLLTPPEEWDLRTEVDRRNPALAYRDRTCTFGELYELRKGENFAAQNTVDVRSERFARCQIQLDALSARIAEVDPDVMVIVGDDHHEWFFPENQPTFAIYHGDEVVNRALTETERQARIDNGGFYSMQVYHPSTDETYPCATGLAEHMIQQAVSQEFDVTTCGEQPTEAGMKRPLGHSYGFVYRRILNSKPIPIVPILVNTYFPPNQPPPRRCYDFGRALGRAIRSWDGDTRIAVAASGGVSHFVVDEDFDRRMLDALARRDTAALTNEPDIMFRSGTSETKNWIVVAGMLSEFDLEMELLDYVPCYRSEAGTGSGMAFATWQ